MALKNTGYAVFYIERLTFQFYLAEYGYLETEEGVDRDTRIRGILTSTTKIIGNHRVNAVVPEEPPDTIYKQGKMPVNALIGRAVKVMGVVAACYAVVGACHIGNYYCRLVQPSQWQASKKEREGVDIKTWSIAKAQNVLRYLQHPVKLKKMHEHTADAINLGIHALQQWKSGNWTLPTASESPCLQATH